MDSPAGMGSNDTVLGRVTFTADGQRRFAQLSGDFNPIHIDPVLARRELFGEPVVHGMHSVVQALELLTRRISMRQSGFSYLEARFLKPLFLDREATFALEEHEEDGFRVTVRQGDATRTELDVRMDRSVGRPSVPLSPAPKVTGEPSEIPILDPRDASNASGALDLYLDTEDFRELFPGLAANGAGGTIAVLLSLTRLVGQVCPGERSLFSTFELRRASEEEPSSADSSLVWRVTRSRPALSFMKMAVQASAYEGSVTSLIRPGPVKQPSCAEVAERVEPGAFAGDGAVVVGGSRGIGEAAAKILAAGDANVWITYRVGEADAERVAAEIGDHGGRCRTLRLDVHDPETLDVGELTADLSRLALYYFASPPIRPSQDTGFSRPTFDAYLEVYVQGLEKLYRQVRSRYPGPILLFFPSSTYVTETTADFGEYAAAKAAGESLCRSIEREDPDLRVVTPRLPPVQTDQTQAVLPRDLAEPLELLLPIMQDFHRS